MLCVCPGAGFEPVVRAELCGGGRGETSSGSESVLLQALQRPRSVVTCRQYCFWLQGQLSHWSAGGFHTDLLVCLNSLIYMNILFYSSIESKSISIIESFTSNLIFLFVLRAQLDQILPPSMWTWSLCVTTGGEHTLITWHWITNQKSERKLRLCLSFRVRLVERGAPQSLPLMESGTVSIDYCPVEDICAAVTLTTPPQR